MTSRAHEDSSTKPAHRSPSDPVSCRADIAIAAFAECLMHGCAH